jgi:hypothetical protein
VGSFLTTEPGKSFVVTTGLIGIGLIEIIRGIYYFSRANSYASQTESIEDYED